MDTIAAAPARDYAGGKMRAAVQDGVGVITFNQEKTPWYAEVGSATAPSATATGSGYWGPTDAADQATFGTKGEGGQLTWNLAVPAAGRTLWLGVSGSQNGSASASQALQQALANPAALLDSKISERDGVAAQTSLQVPDSGVQQALLWSKLNLADLSRTIADAAIRNTKAGTVYPAPLAIVPSLSGIDAAYPDYAEFFGTDGAYSTYGLAVSGQWQTAANWLNAMRTVSEIENGGTGPDALPKLTISPQPTQPVHCVTAANRKPRKQSSSTGPLMNR